MLLGPGEQYVFVTAPVKCAGDAPQVIFNTNAGKSSGYAMDIDSAVSAKDEKTKIQPMTIAIRANREIRKAMKTHLHVESLPGRNYKSTGPE
jgi:hypothetical protein